MSDTATTCHFCMLPYDATFICMRAPPYTALQVVVHPWKVVLRDKSPLSHPKRVGIHCTRRIIVL